MVTEIARDGFFRGFQANVQTTRHCAQFLGHGMAFENMPLTSPPSCGFVVRVCAAVRPAGPGCYVCLEKRAQQAVTMGDLFFVVDEIAKRFKLSASVICCPRMSAGHR
jgi:hypothetical protein